MSTAYAEDPSDEPLAEPLLTAADAAKLLAVRPGWVYAAVREGNLPHSASDGRCGSCAPTSRPLLSTIAPTAAARADDAWRSAPN